MSEAAFQPATITNGPAVVEPGPAETVMPSHEEPGMGKGGFRVILYDDDWHTVDQVIVQVQKATGYDLEKTVGIVLEAHTSGRAICYNGSRDDCHRVAQVLREIRLQVEVDTD